MVKQCDACGEIARDESLSGLTGSWPVDVHGCFVCDACHDARPRDDETGETIVARIRSRRAAAEGPRDAVPTEWREHIGKRVRYASGMNVYGEGILIGAYTRARTTEPCAELRRDGGHSGPAEWRLLSLLAPPQGEASGDGKCWGIASVYQPQPSGIAMRTYNDMLAKSQEAMARAFSITLPPREPIPVQNVTVRMAPDPSLLHFGPDSYPANPAYGIERERSNEERPPRPNFDYDQFCDLIDQHLVPQLPKDLKVVTDVSGGRFCCWVLDASGAEVWSAVRSRMPSAVNLSSDAVEIASALMAERARAGK